MSELDKILASQVAAGEVSTDDAVSIHVFAQFITESPKGLPSALRSGPKAVWACFPSTEAFRAWKTRWLGYATGLADGPTEPDEYAELFPPKEENG